MKVKAWSVKCNVELAVMAETEEEAILKAVSAMNTICISSPNADLIDYGTGLATEIEED